jgi:hypothetical protein
MQRMTAQHAQKILDGGYAFGNKFFSCHDDLLVVHYEDDGYPYQQYYYGTQLKDGKLQVDHHGYVVFRRVEPVIDENTVFRLL